MKIIVHMAQPEVVVEQPNNNCARDSCVREEKKNCLFWRLCHPARSPAAPPPTVASFLVPAPALVPPPAGMGACQPPPGPNNGMGPPGAPGDFGALRAAQDMEMAMARLAAAQAANDAQAKFLSASIDRIQAAAPQLFPPSKSPLPEKLPAPGVKGPVTDGNLAKTVEDLQKHVEKLDALIRIHNEVLKKNFPKDLKQSQNQQPPGGPVLMLPEARELSGQAGVTSAGWQEPKDRQALNKPQ
jgi:hypothetical protein